MIGPVGSYPKISIVTPSFNQGKYIEQTILSVLDQHYPNFEYIIVDGGSTDETVEIIKRYEQRLTWWVSKPDAGQTDAINKGFAKCTGDIFNWINSDDYYEPGTFHKLAALFTNNPSVNVVCGKEWGFNDANQADKILHSGSVIKEDVFETIQIGIIDQPCTFFSKKNIDNFFPLDISLRYVMDRQLWWSYLLKYGQAHILITDEIFTSFRQHPQSKSVGEADLFEAEFDRLKLSLFRQLNIPAIVEKQLPENTAPIAMQWEINIEPANYIAAAFAARFAEKYYVKDDLAAVSQLMQLVRKWKKWVMNKKEWKLWIISTIIPGILINTAKQIKRRS